MDNIFTIAKTGVAVGCETTGTETAPLFQVGIEANFKRPVITGNVEIDTELCPWTDLTGASNTSEITLNYGHKGLNYYVFEDGHVKFEGAVRFSGVNNGDTIISATAIPEEYRPVHPIYFVMPGRSSQSGRYFATIFGYIGTDGHVHIRQTWSFGSGSTDSSTIHWCDIRVQWWV